MTGEPNWGDNRPAERHDRRRGRGLCIAIAYPYWTFGLPPENLSLSLELLAVPLATHLAARGCDVTLYKRAVPGQPNRGVFRGVRYVGFRCQGEAWLRRQYLRMIELRHPRRFDEVISRSPLIVTPIYDARASIDMRKRNVDVAHVFVHDGMVPTVRRVSRRTRIVVHLHDHSQCQRDADEVHRNLARADLIVGCSSFITRQFQSKFPDLADRCIAIPNSVEMDVSQCTTSRRPSDMPPRFLFVGRLSPEKGVHTLINAFLSIHKRVPAAELWLVGPQQVAPISYVDPYGEDGHFDKLRTFFTEDADYLQYLQQLIPADARHKVRFCGNLPFRELGQFYEQASVLVLPSLWAEPFGLPVIEAMAWGLPVIATTFGSHPDVISNEETGFLVERDNAEVLALRMLRLAQDPELRQSMGEVGRRRFQQRFNWTSYVDRWHATYETLVRSH